MPQSEKTKTTQTLYFGIARVPKSINSVGGHWGWRLQEKKKWLGELLVIKQLNPEFDYSPTVRRRISITVYWPKRKKRCRLPDDDNIIAGFKPGRDAMKRLGFVREDNPEWSEWVWSIRRSDSEIYPFAGECRDGWTEFLVEDL